MLQKDPLKIEPADDILILRGKVTEDKSKTNKTKECPDCGKTFEVAWQARRHIKWVHGEKVFACEYCDATFTGNNNLKRHIDKVHLGKIFVCRLCPFKAKEKISVMEHAKKAHPLNDLSKVTFEKVLSPKKDPLRIENCPTCGKYFRKGLSKHIRKAHAEYRWQCEQCDATFSEKSNLQTHVKVIHVGRLFQCGLCPYKSRDKRNVLTHAKKVHPLDDVDKMNLGKVIDKDWQINEKNLKEVPDIKIKKERRKTQMKIKKKKIPRPRHKTCPHCEREFSREENLMRHIAFTHKGHSFECNFCTKHFKDKRNLLRHIARDHPSENLDANDLKKIKPGPNNYFTTRSPSIIDQSKSKYCPHCGKHFMKDLARHIKFVHDGKKGWSCEHCDAKFGRPFGLQRHLNAIHHKERFQCDFCQFSGTDKRSVVKHVKMNHPSEDLDKMKFKIVIGEKSSTRRTGLTKHDAILERFKLSLDQEIAC